MIGYRELLAELFAARRFGMRLDLERVRRALARLGGPERRLGATVHVGGTNGKGSTAAFVEAMLRAAGLRTGLFTSPHLLRLAERFAVDGAPIAEAQVAAAYQAMRGAAAGGEELTFFEQVMVMALWAFAEAGVQATVLEVGMGGRGDATNVVDADVAVVTGVALDHQQYLGDTLGAIAAEKAGIFKAGRGAVIGAAGEPEAVEVLVAAARQAAVASLRVVGRDVPAGAPAGWALGLAGAHQQVNAAAALAALDALAAAGGPAVGEAARRAGLASARVAGRLEAAAERPRVLLDGAHNPHAARALAAALGAPVGRRALVVGVSADKDAAGLLAPLVGGAGLVVATQATSARALGAAELAAAAGAAGAGGEVVVEREPAAALARAKAWAGAEGEVVVTGSLFLVADARRLLLGAPADPVAVADPVGKP